MKAAVALILSFSMLGCFPNNPRHQKYAKYAEGASLVAGIAISAVANTGADCDSMAMAGQDISDCRTKAKWLGTVGMVLILGGLLGFIATVTTAEDAKVQQVNRFATTPAEEKPTLTLPPGVEPQPQQPLPVPDPDPEPSTDDSPTDAPSSSGASAPSAPQQ
jgi:hypothetical protein